MSELNRQLEIEKGRSLYKAHGYGQSEPSELGALVLAMMDRLHDGIYHVERSYLLKADWSNDYFIELLTDGSRLATYDFSGLTHLVYLAHEYAVRVDINPCNFRYMKLLFHLREREGSHSERHPTVEQSLDTFRRHVMGYENAPLAKVA